MTLNGEKLMEAVKMVTLEGKNKFKALEVDIWTELGMHVKTNQFGRYLEPKVPSVVKAEIR